MSMKYEEIIRLLSEDSLQYRQPADLLALITNIEKDLKWLEDEQDVIDCTIALDKMRRIIEPFDTSEEMLSKRQMSKIHTSLITLLRFMEEKSMIGQKWYSDRMKALDYKIDDKGMCFGMCFAALNAFLADELHQFERRLSIIRELPVVFFENDFFKLREKQKICREQGQLDAAEDIQRSLVDILAFFDTIELYQSPEKYKHLLTSQENSQALFQTRRAFASLVEPVAFENAEIKSEEIHPIIMGGYTRSELVNYLELLQSNLGSQSFAIYLSCDQHAINVNYNAQTKQWLYIDPNDLPPQFYASPMTLVEQFFQYREDGVMLNTSIWTQHQHAEEMRANFLRLQTSTVYMQLHSSEKAAKGYDGYRNGCYLDVLTTEGGYLPTSKMLVYLCEEGNIDLVKYFLKQGASLSKEMFQSAYLLHHFELADFFITQGMQPTNEDLMNVITNGDLTAAAFLLDAGVECTALELGFACFQNNLAITQFLIDRGVLPSEDILYEACEDNRISIVKLLIRNGVAPTLKMLETSVKKEHTEVVEILKNAGLATENLQHERITEQKDRVENNNSSMMLIEDEDRVENNNSSMMLIEDEDHVENNNSSMMLIEDEDHVGSIDEYVALVKATSKKPLELACDSGNLVLAQQLVDRGDLPTTEMLREACVKVNIETVDFLMRNGVIPTKNMLGAVCVYYKTRLNLFKTKQEIAREFVSLRTFIFRLMQSIDFSDDKEKLFAAEQEAIECFLDNLCVFGDFSRIKELVKKGVHFTETMLLSSLMAEKLNIAAYLIDYGLQPTPDMLGICCLGQKFSAANLLMTHGIKPDAEMLFVMCKCDEVISTQFLLDAGVIPTAEIIEFVDAHGSEQLKHVFSKQTNIAVSNTQTSMVKAVAFKADYTELREGEREPSHTQVKPRSFH